DVVLEQPVDEDDVGPHQFLPARDLVEDGGAVVDDEFEVEIRDPNARVAGARGGLADVASSAAEPEVTAFDRVEEHRTIDLLEVGEREGGIALELCQSEVWSEGRDHRPDEVCEDVLRVIELGV